MSNPAGPRATCAKDGRLRDPRSPLQVLYPAERAATQTRGRVRMARGIRSGSPTLTPCWSAISRTTASCVGPRAAASRCSGSPPASPTATRRDRQGRLDRAAPTCTAALPAPSWTAASPVLADRYDGKRLNAPNDVVCRSDGTIWFTDPHYGINTDYEGGKQAPELPPSLCQPSRGSPQVPTWRVPDPDDLP